METDAAVNIFILQMNKVSERSNNLSKFAQLVSGIPIFTYIYLYPHGTPFLSSPIYR